MILLAKSIDGVYDSDPKTNPDAKKYDEISIQEVIDLSLIHIYWYIWSCKKIKYMFPKAHAAAYVMMAFRIAWYKMFYPLAYYAAYFSIRASAFSYELMCQGQEKLLHYMDEYLSLIHI